MRWPCRVPFGDDPVLVWWGYSPISELEEIIPKKIRSRTQADPKQKRKKSIADDWGGLEIVRN